MKKNDMKAQLAAHIAVTSEPEPEKPATKKEPPKSKAKPMVAESAPAVPATARKGRGGNPGQRVTIYVFDPDLRAFDVIRERLHNAGFPFVNRSQIAKIAVRLAASASPGDLARAFEDARADDKRYRP